MLTDLSIKAHIKGCVIISFTRCIQAAGGDTQTKQIILGREKFGKVW